MNKSENIKAFDAALKENKELLDKFNAAAKRIMENKEAESDAGLIVKAAAEIGFTLTEAEIERQMANTQEIGDEELANVAGGNNDSNTFEVEYTWCWLNVGCYYISRTDICTENFF